MKKFLEVLGKILTIIVTVLAVGMMVFTIVSVLTFNRTDRNLFGFKPLIVLSDSMSATDFSAGDLVLIKEVDVTTLQPGDIIAFESTNPESMGEIFTHKIRSLTEDSYGNKGFITYGTTTGVDDEKIVTYGYVIGKYIFSVPKVGLFFNFLKTTPGYIVCILLPFVLLILFRAIDTVKLFRQYKKEQMAEIEQQRNALRQQMEENQRMLQELMALRSQSGNNPPQN